MYNPTISIIITNYNYANFICAAIQSAIDQTYKNVIDIVVVDDNSTDNSVEVIKKFLENQKQTRKNFKLVINKQNGGPAGARNAGIQHAEGEMLAFLDADDFYYPEKISKSIHWFEKPEVALVYSDYDVMDLKTSSIQREFKHSYNLKILNDICIVSTNSLMRKESVIKVGGFDTRFRGTEDYNMYLKLSKQNMGIHIPESLFLYRVHGKNITMTTDHQQFAYDVATFKKELNS